MICIPPYPQPYITIKPNDITLIRVISLRVTIGGCFATRAISILRASASTIIALLFVNHKLPGLQNLHSLEWYYCNLDCHHCSPDQKLHSLDLHYTLGWHYILGHPPSLDWHQIPEFILADILLDHNCNLDWLPNSVHPHIVLAVVGSSFGRILDCHSYQNCFLVAHRPP